jgi:acetylornithine/succinyldiaminopimelate/putrescine aminotransferase
MSQDPASQPFETFDALADVFREHIAPNKLAYYQRMGLQIVIGKREGIWFEDAYTKLRLINCHGNGGVFSLGHCNPRVTGAVAAALGKLDIGNHHFVSAQRAQLASRLSATLDDALPRVVFGVSGGEAVDLAIKAARGATARPKIISVEGGYHGHTGLALAAGDASFRDPFGPNLPGFVQVPFNDVGAMEAAIDDQTAAVILEAIPATLGMPIPEPGYFTSIRKLCDDRGALLLVDEVQTGLGRTGRWWGVEHEEVIPDAIITGKGLSGGIYPISATLLTREMHEVLDREANPFVHISTFGGAELGCVAAQAVLDIVGEPGFLGHVEALSERFADALDPLPFELRRRGLFMGLRFSSDVEALGALLRIMQQGIFCFPAANDRCVLQFLPPLILTDDEAEDLIARMTKAFA